MTIESRVKWGPMPLNGKKTGIIKEGETRTFRFQSFFAPGRIISLEVESDRIRARNSQEPNTMITYNREEINKAGIVMPASAKVLEKEPSKLPFIFFLLPTIHLTWKK